MSRHRWGATGLAALVGCGRPAPSPPTPPTPPTTTSEAPPPPACVGSPLRAYEERPGVLQRVFVDLPIDGRPMPFFLDTGSEQTFRRIDGDVASEPVAHATASTISCIDVGLAFSRASVFRKTPDGRPVGGVLGTDLLKVGGVLDLRIRDALFVWSRTVPPAPSGAVELPLTLVASRDPYASGKLVVDDVALDGKKTRLLLDTGSPHVVIIDGAARPNEREVDAFDGGGANVTFYESTIDLAFAGRPRRTVVVDRAASFPTLEKVFAALGGDVGGVLGIGALGDERIVIGKDEVWFVP